MSLSNRILGDREEVEASDDELVVPHSPSTVNASLSKTAVLADMQKKPSSRAESPVETSLASTHSMDSRQSVSSVEDKGSESPSEIDMSDPSDNGASTTPDSNNSKIPTPTRETVTSAIQPSVTSVSTPPRLRVQVEQASSTPVDKDKSNPAFFGLGLPASPTRAVSHTPSTLHRSMSSPGRLADQWGPHRPDYIDPVLITESETIVQQIVAEAASTDADLFDYWGKLRGEIKLTPETLRSSGSNNKLTSSRAESQQPIAQDHSPIATPQAHPVPIYSENIFDGLTSLAFLTGGVVLGVLFILHPPAIAAAFVHSLIDTALGGSVSYAATIGGFGGGFLGVFLKTVIDCLYYCTPSYSDNSPQQVVVRGGSTALIQGSTGRGGGINPTLVYDPQGSPHPSSPAQSSPSPNVSVLAHLSRSRAFFGNDKTDFLPPSPEATTAAVTSSSQGTCPHPVPPCTQTQPTLLPGGTQNPPRLQPQRYRPHW